PPPGAPEGRAGVAAPEPAQRPAAEAADLRRDPTRRLDRAARHPQELRQRLLRQCGPSRGHGGGPFSETARRLDEAVASHPVHLRPSSWLTYEWVSHDQDDASRTSARIPGRAGAAGR